MADVLLFSAQRSFFSDTTPPALRHILNAAVCAEDPRIVEALLLRARREWPEEPDVHISLYKFYFVANRYERAESAVWTALKMAAAEMGIDRNYRRLSPQSADWSLCNGPERLYLFSLKALGVIRLRRGRVAQARAVLQKLLELDPHDEIGGGSYLYIAQSFTDEEA